MTVYAAASIYCERSHPTPSHGYSPFWAGRWAWAASTCSRGTTRWTAIRWRRPSPPPARPNTPSARPTAWWRCCGGCFDVRAWPALALPRNTAAKTGCPRTTAEVGGDDDETRDSCNYCVLIRCSPSTRRWPLESCAHAGNHLYHITAKSGRLERRCACHPSPAVKRWWLLYYYITMLLWYYSCRRLTIILLGINMVLKKRRSRRNVTVTIIFYYTVPTRHTRARNTVVTKKINIFFVIFWRALRQHYT